MDGSSELLTYFTRAHLLLSPEDNSNSGSGSGGSASQQHTMRIPCVALLSTHGLSLCTLGDRPNAVAELMYELADVNEMRVFPGGQDEGAGGRAAPVVEFHLTVSVSEPASHVPSPPPPFRPAAAAAAGAAESHSGGQHQSEARAAPAVLRVELAPFALAEALALLHLFSLIKFLHT